jgi:hypothetical protein
MKTIPTERSTKIISRDMHTSYAFKLFSISIAALSLAIMVAGVASATSATLNVTNYGADSAACGSPAKPCRTISQAIENAFDGDSIEVGPGLYGNVSGNVNFTGPGDEHAQMSRLPNQGCIICINKGVHIYSLQGAAVTTIQGIPSTPFASTVMIQSDGVIFGHAGGGFTLTGGNVNGVILDINGDELSTFGIVLKRPVKVEGNVDVGDQNGFVFKGLDFTDRPCPDPSCTSTAEITFSDNESINNGAGFNVTVNTFHEPIIFQSNIAQGGGTGFFVDPGFQNIIGERLGAGNVVLLNNVAVHNGVGFNLTLVGRTERNTAAGNSQTGFLVVPLGTFAGNSALGNAGPGIIIDFAANFPSLSPPTNNYSFFAQNNFFGNDRNRPVLNVAPSVGPNPAPDPGPSAHCGVLNLGDVAAAELAGFGQGSLDPQTLNAGDSFWGSTHGPALTGAGDGVGGVCDQNGAVTIAKSFATIQFAITAWP